MPRGRISEQPDLFAEPPSGSMGAIPDLPSGWLEALKPEFRKQYWANLHAFVVDERSKFTVYPASSEVYTAFHATPFKAVRVLILGQDPYPGEKQAHGLSFSVKPGVDLPASLRNIFRELESDTGVPPVRSGSLTGWAQQGILMLNAVLTVRAGLPNSHKDKGWETFTDAVIRKVNDKRDRMVFVLWGAYAQKKITLIDTTRHTVIKSPHPSPLSASTGFFGSKPFSQINAALQASGSRPINWSQAAK